MAMDIIAKEKHSTTFLSILDDKNKIISILKQQLENQKLQILYYIKRELKYTKVTELSRTCRIENTEDLPVLLALTQFRKQNGMKSNIVRLYDYMEQIDQKLNRNLKCQEFILRKIIEKLCQVMKKPEENQLTYIHTSNQNVYLDLFNALLEVSIGLRQKLDSFRICCNRLILIEDERNGIVEQVLGLPIEQRIQCNFLINLKQERMELDKKIKEIKSHQEYQKEGTKEQFFLENQLNGLPDNIKLSIREIEDFSTVGNMVDDLNLKAKRLLNESEKRKRRSQLQQTGIIVNLIKLAANGGELHSENKYKQIVFEAIKKEIHILETRLKHEHQITKSENECIKYKLKSVLQERNELKVIKTELQNRIKNIQKNHAIEVASLQQQRDFYKTKVEVCNLIKPNSKSSHNENEKTKTIKHLERKLSLMNEMINKQNKEITIQNDFIENLKCFYKKKTNSDPEQNCNKQESNSSKEYYEENSTVVSKEKLNYKIPLTLPTSSRDAFRNRKVKEMIQNVLKDIRSNKNTNLSSFSLEVKCSCKEGKKLDNCLCNELELMRDCSHESIPVFCAPISKKNYNTTDTESTNRYSKNIEVLVQKNKLHSASEDYSFSAF